MKSNNYYWYFRMKTGFFNTPEIQAMLDVPHYGDKLVLTLLRLYDYSTYNKGIIKIRKVDENDTYIRYLSEKLNLDYKFMSSAMKYYVENGFVEIAENNVENVLIGVPYVKENTGKSSNEADRIRKLRAGANNLIEGEIRGNLKSFGINNNVLLSSKEYKELKKDYKDIEQYINLYSVNKKSLDCEIDNDFEEFKLYMLDRVSN